MIAKDIGKKLRGRKEGRIEMQKIERRKRYIAYLLHLIQWRRGKKESKSHRRAECARGGVCNGYLNRLALGSTPWKEKGVGGRRRKTNFTGEGWKRRDTSQK